MKPRVVLLHPQYFNARDMQFYVPLLGEFDVVAVTPRWQPHRRTYDKIPQAALLSLDQVLGRWTPVRGAVDKVFRLRSENLIHFWGLKGVLEGAAIVECLETFHPYCRQATELKGALGYKLAFSVHENIAFAHENLAFRRETKRRAFGAGDAFFALCEQGRSSLILEGAPADKVHLTGAAVDTDLYSPGTPDPDALAPLGLAGTPAGEITLLFAGRLLWEKGPQEALSALALLRRRDPDRRYRLLLAGDGEDADRLRGQAQRLKIEDRVRFLGRVSTPQMVALYRLADVCLVPSIPTPKWQEQFGCVLIEAMACGCPVIATRTGAIPEVVGDAGVLVAPAHHTELADAVADLAADPRGRAERAALGRDRVVGRYRNEGVADRIRSVYRRLLQA